LTSKNNEWLTYVIFKNMSTSRAGRLGVNRLRMHKRKGENEMLGHMGE